MLLNVLFVGIYIVEFEGFGFGLFVGWMFVGMGVCIMLIVCLFG